MSDRREVVGVLGGTFDPVHVGHVAIALEVRRRLGLRRVLLLPASQPPHKSTSALSAAVDREAMVRLAIRGHRGLEVCTLELVHRGVQYTIDSLRRLRMGPLGRDPVFVVGMDSLLDFPTWHEFRRLIAEFDLVVVDRPERGYRESMEHLHPEISDRVRAVPESDSPALANLGRGGRILYLPMDPVAVSSSDIRRRAANGQPLDGLVPKAVARYIQENHLYRLEEPS